MCANETRRTREEQVPTSPGCRCGAEVAGRFVVEAQHVAVVKGGIVVHAGHQRIGRRRQRGASGLGNRKGVAAGGMASCLQRSSLI